MLGGDPWSVMVSSVTLFVAEGALLLWFVIGLFAVCRWLAVRAGVWRVVRRLLGGSARGWGGVSVARLLVWQCVWLACASVLFKIVLYSTVRGSSRSLNGGDGFAFWYANGAEVVIVFCVLAGLGRWVRAGARREVES